MDTHDYTKGPRTHLVYPERTMFQMIEQVAKEYPGEPAYEFYGKKTSFGSFVRRIEAAAKGLKALGIGTGDRVTICLPNIPQAVDSFYAVNRLGATCNMIHPLSAEAEITWYLTCAKSPLIITVDMFYEKVKKAVEAVKHPVRIVAVRIQDELPGILAPLYALRTGRPYLKYPQGTDLLYRKMLANGLSQTLPEAEYDPERTAAILYSGGTTGKPKGVCLTDLNFNALGMEARESIDQQFRPGLTILACMPMFHGFGLGINIHTVLMYGVSCILMPSFNIRTYSRMLLKKRPSFIAGVPTLFDALLRADALKNADLSHLQGMFCGGDSLSVELKKRVDAFLREHGADIQVREGYGLTECVTASCLTPKDVYREHSIGLPFPDIVYDIVKPGTDETVPRGAEGEIVLKGPTLMQGYLDEPEETAKALRRRSDGDIWLYTGDMGRMDEDGYVYFLYRIKRMIITNGYNVYPAILEEVLDRQEGVDSSCVIGIPDERRGQRIRACVILKEGVPETAETKERLMEGMRREVAKYALPKEIVFRKEFPKTLVGKIAYHQLEEEN